MDPLITVVVPVYRTEPWLRQCADSLLAQTLSELEILFVDDGTPDGGGAVCDEYAARDGRVRVIHKANGGVMSAVIAGIRAARAPFVGFTDSDDWVDPTYYEDLYRALRDARADVAVAEYICHFPDREEVYARPEPAVRKAPDGGRALLYGYFRTVYTDTPAAPDVMSKCDKLYRRERLTENLPYFCEDVWHGEDAMMNVAVLADCACVALTSGGGRYHYRIRPDSASHDESAKVSTARWTKNELAYLQTLGRILADKDLAREPFAHYLGRVAYAAAFNSAARRNVSFREKRRYALQVVRAVPPEALAAYARRRHALPVTIYCRLLQARLVTPCVWMSVLSARLERK